MEMENTSLKIALLYPNIAGLQGDTANILAIKRIAKLNNINLDIVTINSDFEDFSPLDFDMILMSPGEIIGFQLWKDTLSPLKSEFEEFINSGKPFLVTGTSMALWGESVLREDGSAYDGIGLIPLRSEERTLIYGDDLFIEANYAGKQILLLGSQIQLANYYLLDESKRFGDVIYGFGNNGQDRTDGVQIKNSIFTNMLGPVLIMNPWLAVEMMTVALKNKGLDKTISYDSSFEKESIKVKLQKISQKKSELENTNPKDVLSKELNFPN